MKKASANLRKQYVKQYLKLLTQAVSNTAHSVDDYFFDSESEEDSEVRTYFYFSMAFGIIASLYVLFKII